MIKPNGDTLSIVQEHATACKTGIHVKPLCVTTGSMSTQVHGL